MQCCLNPYSNGMRIELVAMMLLCLSVNAVLILILMECG